MHRTLDEDMRRVKTLLEREASTVSGTDAGLAWIVRVPVPDLCALWAETATAPMTIALIGAVEGTPLMGPDGDVALARVRSFVEARLPRALMLLRTLRATHLGQGTPAWIDARRCDITLHRTPELADAANARRDSSCAPRFRSEPMEAAMRAHVQYCRPCRRRA